MYPLDGASLNEPSAPQDWSSNVRRFDSYSPMRMQELDALRSSGLPRRGVSPLALEEQEIQERGSRGLTSLLADGRHSGLASRFLFQDINPPTTLGSSGSSISVPALGGTTGSSSILDVLEDHSGDMQQSSSSSTSTRDTSRAPLSKYWCVTSFKDNIPHEYDPEKISYIIFQQEETKTERKHWQIYIEFTNKVRPEKVKKYLNDPAAHCELRRGTAQEAANYCRKQDSAIPNTQFEAGIISKAKVNQMDDLKEAIQRGATINQIADNHTGMFLRYNKSIDRLISMRDYQTPVSYKPVQVVCLYGPPGCGKTRYVHDYVQHHYNGVMFSKYYEKGQPSWWDGYVDQKCILIDDFEGDAPINELLQLLDGYGHNKLWPIKGSFIKINPEVIFFTSNSHPRQWYAATQSATKVDALLRRFTSIHTCEIGTTSLLFRP